MTGRARGERPQEETPSAATPLAVAAPLPLNWWKMDGEDQSDTLETLSIWVPELVRRYSLTAQLIPPCWYLHDSLIQELLALFQYRNQMQFNLSLGPPPSAPLDFHVQFKLWRDRMREWVSEAGCVQGNHEEPRVQSWANFTTPAHASWFTELEDVMFKMSVGRNTLDPVQPDEGSAA